MRTVVVSARQCSWCLLVVAAVALVVCTCTAQTAAGAQGKYKFELSLSLAKDTYMLGEEISATCTLTSLSEVEACIAEPATREARGEVSYEIRNLDTQEIIPRPPLPKIHGARWVNPNRVGEPVTLQPGEKVSYTYDFSEDYRLYTPRTPEQSKAKPGRYSVKAIYDDGADRLVSNEVPFRITQLSAPEKQAATTYTRIVGPSGDREFKVSQCRLLLDESPTSIFARRTRIILADTYRTMEAYEAAIAECRSLLDSQLTTGQERQVRWTLGWAYHETGHREQAIAEMEKACTLEARSLARRWSVEGKP